MRFELLALYGGPDQVMTVTSGLASVLGLLLLFWNKVVGIFFKVVRNVPPLRYACRTVKPPRTLQKELRNFGSASCAKKLSSSDWTGSSPALWKRCWNAESFPTWRKFEPPAVTPA